jgi:phage shock protein PspC (stress-responsive transcriptional regulator)
LISFQFSVYQKKKIRIIVNQRIKEEFKMSTLIRKLSSRKLWACIAGVVLGIATAMGADSNTIQTISGAVISAVSLVSYIMAEAKVDAAGAGGNVDISAIIDKVKEAIEKITAAVDTVKSTSDTVSGTNDTKNEENNTVSGTNDTNSAETATTTADTNINN